jgi:MIP family channel proteins
LIVSTTAGPRTPPRYPPRSPERPRPAERDPRRTAPASASRAASAELVGTFFLVYAGTATVAAASLNKSIAGGAPDSLAVALAFGLVLTAMVGALGHISGAHFNAAVTLGLAVTHRFPWRFVPTYLIAQLLGAIVGAAATWATYGSRARSQAMLGATIPGPGVGQLRAVIVEALITFLLVFVIIATAGDQRVPPALAAPAIGFALVVAVLIGGPVTGGAVNPDRALGPMLLSLHLAKAWIYLVGPLAGGTVAALVYDRFISRTEAPKP